MLDKNCSGSRKRGSSSKGSKKCFVLKSQGPRALPYTLHTETILDTGLLRNLVTHPSLCRPTSYLSYIIFGLLKSYVFLCVNSGASPWVVGVTRAKFHRCLRGAHDQYRSYLYDLGFVGAFFVLLELNPFCCAMAHQSEVRELGLALLGLRFRPTCAQVKLIQCRRVLT